GTEPGADGGQNSHQVPVVKLVQRFLVPGLNTLKEGVGSGWLRHSFPRSRIPKLRAETGNSSRKTIARRSLPCHSPLPTLADEDDIDRFPSAKGKCNGEEASAGGCMCMCSNRLRASQRGQGRARG